MLTRSRKVKTRRSQLRNSPRRAKRSPPREKRNNRAARIRSKRTMKTFWSR